MASVTEILILDEVGDVLTVDVSCVRMMKGCPTCMRPYALFLFNNQPLHFEYV